MHNAKRSPAIYVRTLKEEDMMTGSFLSIQRISNLLVCSDHPLLSNAVSFFGQSCCNSSYHRSVRLKEKRSEEYPEEIRTGSEKRIWIKKISTIMQWRVKPNHRHHRLFLSLTKMSWATSYGR